MKIALVHDFLTKIGGAEKVLQVFHEIFPDAPIYTLLYDKKGTQNLFESTDYTIIPSGLNRLPRAIRTRPKFLLGKFSSAIEEFDFSEYDVVISLSNSFAHGIITKPTTLHVCYCYSPMRYSWDWYHEYLQENKIGYNLKGFYVRWLLHQIRIWDRVSAKRVDRWIAQSKTAQERINKYFCADATIIHPPVDLSRFKTNSEEPEDFCLIVSRLEPYKKVDIAIEAFNELQRPLVIIGEGSDQKRLESMAKTNIEFLGWQSDKVVSEKMKKAYALIFPGEEDFGLTPVEAMAAGRPVVAFNKGGVTETVKEGVTGTFFNEPTAESLRKTIERFSENYHNFSPDACKAQAQQFSQATFIAKIKEYIETSHREFIHDYQKR